MFQLRTTGCCGVLEMEDISTQAGPKEVLDGLAGQLRANCSDWEREKPFVLFTSVVQRVTGDHVDTFGNRHDDYGLALADYLEQNDLGTVNRTIEPKPNYTRNPIKIWIWTPNYEKMKELYPAPPQPVGYDAAQCNCKDCLVRRIRLNIPTIVPTASDLIPSITYDFTTESNG